MKRLSRTRLFLLEMMVNLLVFCVGAAICLMAFAKAYALSAESRVLSQAQRTAENAAMALRSLDGDLSALPYLLDGQMQEGKFIAWYSQDWQPVTEENSIYQMEVSAEMGDNHVLNLEIIIYSPAHEAVLTLPLRQYTGDAQKRGNI